MKNSKPRNLVKQDGLYWISRAEILWGDYETCAEYLGLVSKSFATYVWRHNLKTIKHGKCSLVRKDHLDKRTGAVDRVPVCSDAKLPLRGRRKKRSPTCVSK